MANKIQKFRDEFLMINQCKDPRMKDKSLGVLMTVIENEYNIPAFKDEEYNKSNPVVMALYTDISNARFT